MGRIWSFLKQRASRESYILWLLIITVLSTAQKSDHQFSSVKEERAALIFNYRPTDVQDYLPFVQAYFF